jgi:cell wall-associated NlpC family hydrolase
MIATAALSPCALARAQEPIKTLEVMSSAAMTLRDSVVAVARAQIGRRYVMGGVSPKGGFDCSGLVQYVMASLNVRVPRTTRTQAVVGRSIDRDSLALRAGDLLLFGNKNGGISHVGIYVGNGRYIHASSIAGRVIESPLNRPPSPLVKILKDVRRVLAAGDTLPRRVIASAGVVPVSITALIAARQRQ